MNYTNKNNQLVLPKRKSSACNFWNCFWAKADTLHPLGREASELIEEVQRCTPKADCILEIGSGDGRNLLDLVKNGRHVIGVDISEAAIRRADLQITRSSNIELLVGSGYDLALPDESIDLVIAIDLMNHLDTPTEFCSEVWRILKKGGRFIGNAMSLRDPSRTTVASKGEPISPEHFSIPWDGLPNQEPVWLTMRYYEKERLNKLFGDFVWIKPPTEYMREDLGHPLPFDSHPHEHVFWKLNLQKP